MNRKSRILMALVALGLVPATASPVALAGSPLLSGYGGPGTGEQAVIGSTLIGGGGGAGGPSGSSGSGATGSTSAGSGSGATGAATTSVGNSASRGSGEGPRGGSGAGRAGRSRATGSPFNRDAAGGKGVQIHAFVYPSALRSASTDSPALGISGADLLLLLAAIVTLALVTAMTLRLSRLQR